MKKIFFIIFILFAAVVYAEDDYPVGSQLNIDGSTLGWDNTAKKWRPVAVNENGGLTSSSDSPVIASISIDTSNIELHLRSLDSDTEDIKTEVSSISQNIGELLTSQSASDVTIGSISVDTSKIESYLKTETGTANSPNPKSLAEMLTWNSWAEYQPYPIIATHTIGNMVATISESLIYKLRSDTYPYNVLSTHSLAEIAYNIKDDVNSLKQSTDTQPKVFGTKRISASANTTVRILPMAGFEIDPALVSQRIFIELRATDPNADFYIGFDSNITDSDGRPVKGRILLNMPQSQNLYIYHTNTSAIAIQQTEGWR